MIAPVLVVTVALAATLAATPMPADRFLAEVRTRVDAAAKTDATVVAGNDGFLFLVPELKSLATAPPAIAAATDAAVAAIVDFKSQLDGLGIDSLFVPVPAKAAIYPDKLVAGATPRVDAVHAGILDALRNKGVPVVDLAPLFVAHRDDPGGALYCRTDSHWSGRAIALAAKEIARLAGDRPWRKDVARTTYATEERDVTIAGDLWRALPDPKPAKETLRLTFVGTRTAAGLEPVKPSRTSPVLLLGDSHDSVFHAGAELHAVGAGLPDLLAAELGFPVDVVAVRGSGATPARVNLARRGDGLAGKRLVVWCLSARELTAGAEAWRKVPVVPAK